MEWVTTDANWQTEPSGFYHSELYDGVSMDFSRDRYVGWTQAGFPDDLWHERAAVIHPAPVKIVAQDFPPIRVERTLEPKAVTEPKPGVFVYDFGQNFSGVARVILMQSGCDKGATSICRDSESGWHDLHGQFAHSEGYRFLYAA